MNFTTTKYIYFSILLCSFFCALEALAPFNQNKKRTLIACDIDEVLITGRESGITWWLAKPTNWSFALTLRNTMNKYNLHDTTEIINKIMTKHPKLTKKALEFKKVLSKGKLIKGTIALLEKLLSQGYTIIPASNMTKGTYFSLIETQKLPPSIFNKEQYFVKTKKSNKKPDGSYFAKPETNFFNHLKEYVEKKFPGQFDTILFIDDKRKNFDGAKKSGLQAIRFRNPKQLQTSLRAFGIVV